jgi:hypothetical protein
MNKTLLLILCDFLLLTLLALTRWEDAQPAAPAAKAARPAVAAPAQAGEGAATPEQDMVAVMKLSLEDEQTRREELVQALSTTEAARTAAEGEKARLTDELTRSEQSATELDHALTTTRAAAEVERARNAQLARDLIAREAEAKRREEELARVAASEAAARARVEELAVSVGVAQREKQMLQEQAETLRAAVEAERADRQRVQLATTELAVGVGQIAEQTGALSKELRESRPINANTLYSDFLARRVGAKFDAERATFLGPVKRDPATRTVLASDGKDVVALLHVDDTPFDLHAPSQHDWERLVLELTRDGATVRPSRLEFASLDPRVLMVPLTAEQAERLGGEPYLLALDPFKFPEAVLISAGGAGYGELTFKLDPKNSGYVRVDNRLVKRLFGDFAPSRGDLVLSKTGELLGLMVAPDTCALIKNFLPQRALPLGEDIRATPTGPILDAVAKRYSVLSSELK